MIFFYKKEESFIKFIEDKLKYKIKSEYKFEEIDLKNINEEEITSSDIYKEMNTFLDKFYKEDGVQDKGVHPNSLGHKFMYPMWREFIKQFIDYQ